MNSHLDSLNQWDAMSVFWNRTSASGLDAAISAKLSINSCNFIIWILTKNGQRCIQWDLRSNCAAGIGNWKWLPRRSSCRGNTVFSRKVGIINWWFRWKRSRGRGNCFCPTGFVRRISERDIQSNLFRKLVWKPLSYKVFSGGRCVYPVVWVG